MSNAQTDDIAKMDFKQLRNAVQLLRDELAIMKRKYEDILYNLDVDNFSRRIVKQGERMYTKIEQSAEKIEMQAQDIRDNQTNISTLTQTAKDINMNVQSVQGEVGGLKTDVAELSIAANEITSKVETIEDDIVRQGTSISQNAENITLISSGEYINGELNKYRTGIQISPTEIEMLNNGGYAKFEENGLKFYDINDQVEGWSVEPDSDMGYGGVLNYYVNGGKAYAFGTGLAKTKKRGTELYSDTDLVIKATSNQRGRFVVDVAESNNSEIYFWGLSYSPYIPDTPCIYVNNETNTGIVPLATQDWVKNNVSAVAVFA